MLLNPNVIYWLNKISSYYEEFDIKDYDRDLYRLLDAVVTAKDDLYEKYRAYVGADLIEIQVERDGADRYHVAVFLTERGSRALPALKRGLFWNSTTETIDFEATTTEYKSYLTQGVEDRLYDKILKLKEPEFASLRAAFVAHRLKATRGGDRRWYVKAKEPNS